MTDRSTILSNASNLISGERAKAYGDAHDNFTLVGELWAPILGMKVITPHEVALMLAQLKVARLIANPSHEDSWTDAAGYIALGAEIATQREGAS